MLNLLLASPLAFILLIVAAAHLQQVILSGSVAIELSAAPLNHLDGLAFSALGIYDVQV